MQFLWGSQPKQIYPRFKRVSIETSSKNNLSIFMTFNDFTSTLNMIHSNVKQLKTFMVRLATNSDKLTGEIPHLFIEILRWCENECKIKAKHRFQFHVQVTTFFLLFRLFVGSERYINNQNESQGDSSKTFRTSILWTFCLIISLLNQKLLSSWSPWVTSYIQRFH